MAKKIFITLFILISIPVLSSAAELKYYEYNPYTSDYLFVASAQTPYQTFIPFDDYLSGFDFFLANTSSSGQATFILLDDSDNILSSKTITVPYIAPTTWGGQRFHVELNSPVKVASDQTYKIEIKSSMPQLRIYYTDMVQLQVQNSNDTLDKQIGPVYLGSNEQPYTFNFSLYETGDVSAPILSNVIPSVLDSNDVRINFNTNEPADYKISYWPLENQSAVQSTNYSGNYFTCQYGLGTCSMDLSVMPNVAYVFQLFVKDNWGNEGSYVGSFISSPGWQPSASTTSSTAPNNESTSTAIQLAISNPQIVALSTSSVEISWETNEAANSSLLIRLDKPGSQTLTSVGDETYELEHLLITENVLSSDTKYVAMIVSIDPSGDFAEAYLNFNTLQGSLINPQAFTDNNQTGQISQTSQTATATQTQSSQAPNLNISTNNGSGSGSSNSSAVISWPSSAESNQGFRIDIFNSKSQLIKQISAGSADYTAAADLKPGNYYAIVYKKIGNNAYKKVASAKSFSIPDKQRVASGSLPMALIYYIVGFGVMLVAGALIFKSLKKKSLPQNEN